MTWTILPYLLPIFLAAAIGGGVAYYAWKKRPTPGAGPMAAMALAIAVWSFFYALELGSSSLAAKVFWCKIQYLGIVSAPVAWFFLALDYTGQEHWTTRRNLAFLSLIPLSTIVILWVEPTLVWPENDVAVGGPVTFFAPTHGLWFWVQIGYSYLLLLFGSVMMAVGAIRSPNLYRWQAGAFLTSILLPWAANLCYISGLTPLDLTPFGFALSTLLVAGGIFRVQLFDVMPVARTAIVESMKDPVLVLDGQNRVVDANPASQSLTSRAPSDLVGQPVEELVGPISALVSRSEESAHAYEELEVGAGGEQRFYLVRLSTVRDRRDRIRGRLLLFHDITDRRRAEEALRREKAFSEAIVDALPGVFYLLDEQGQLLRWNENLERVTGYSGAEISQIDPFVMVADEERQMAQYQLRTAFSRGEITAEMAFASKEGREMPYLFTGRRVDLGDQPYLVGVGLDITERKERERQLQSFVTVSRALRAANRRDQMLPVILDEAMRLLQAGGAMLVTHPQAGCRSVDLARGGWQPLSGRELEVGHPLQEFSAQAFFLEEDVRNVPEWPQPELLDPFYAVVGAPLMQDGEVTGVILIGRRQPFSEVEGRSLAAICEIAANALNRADILETVEQRVVERTGELNAANQRLRELDRVKSKLIDDVSHELRTPVTTMRLYLNLLERGKPSERQRYLEVLNQQSDRLNKVIESVLHFSRLEAIAAGESLGPVDLNRVVREVIVTHQAQAEARDLELYRQADASLPPARGIPALMAYALSHLVDNAVKYTPHGEIAVRTSFDEERQMVCVQVQDTGIGISHEELPHVFDRFYRGQRVSQLTTPGPGLGLALVQQIVMRHQGQVEIESEVDQGTTVRLWLPPCRNGHSPA